MKKKLVVIAHNIRSAHNVGAILRTSDGAGVASVYFTGYTPAPFQEGKDKYETNAHKMISKTALGAEKSVSWQKTENIEKIIKYFKEKKFQIIALEINKKSQNIFQFKPEYPCALILGNEVRGVEKKLMDASDAVVSIPMKGIKESLNVSVAAGIAIYKILN